MWGAARRSARSQTAPTTTRAWPGRGPNLSREGWLRLPHSNKSIYFTFLIPSLARCPNLGRPGSGLESFPKTIWLREVPRPLAHGTVGTVLLWAHAAGTPWTATATP